jgi:signal transduction histidine kinase
MGGHFGLENMRERAQLIAADLEVASQPGEGTQITLSWRPEQGAP